MKITGVTLEQFTDTVYYVSRNHYDGNVIVHDDAREWGVRRPITQARLRTITGKGPDRDSLAPGARRSAGTGARFPIACWHAYRDVLEALFVRFPDARVQTSMADYRGAEGFQRNYPLTAYRNIGSMFQPATMPELCDCGATSPDLPHRAERVDPYSWDDSYTETWRTINSPIGKIMVRA